MVASSAVSNSVEKRINFFYRRASGFHMGLANYFTRVHLRVQRAVHRLGGLFELSLLNNSCQCVGQLTIRTALHHCIWRSAVRCLGRFFHGRAHIM